MPHPLEMKPAEFQNYRRAWPGSWFYTGRSHALKCDRRCGNPNCCATVIKKVFRWKLR